MFYEADFALVVVPLMLVMMVGMGLMMWFMMQKMMMTGHAPAGPGESREAQTVRGMVFLRQEIASLQQETASLRRDLEAMRGGTTPAGSSSVALPEPERGR